MQNTATPSSSVEPHPFDTASDGSLPYFGSMVHRLQLNPTQDSTSSSVPLKAEKAVDCTGLITVDNHSYNQLRSFAEKAVRNESIPINLPCPIIWNMGRKAHRVGHAPTKIIHLDCHSSEVVCRLLWHLHTLGRGVDELARGRLDIRTN
jgi:hypothetical protein